MQFNFSKFVNGEIVSIRASFTRSWQHLATTAPLVQSIRQCTIQRSTLKFRGYALITRDFALGLASRWMPAVLFKVLVQGHFVLFFHESDETVLVVVQLGSQGVSAKDPIEWLAVTDRSDGCFRTS
jgi:hypothetical protein